MLRWRSSGGLSFGLQRSSAEGWQLSYTDTCCTRRWIAKHEDELHLPDTVSCSVRAVDCRGGIVLRPMRQRVCRYLRYQTVSSLLLQQYEEEAVRRRIEIMDETVPACGTLAPVPTRISDKHLTQVVNAQHPSHKVARHLSNCYVDGLRYVYSGMIYNL